MKLYGSQTSPYVRRIRLLLANQSYQFVNMHIFAEEDRQTLLALNPTLKIPMLEQEGKIIFDSGVIYRFLAAQFQLAALSWYQENQLTVINAVSDSLVSLFLCQRSGLDTNEDRLFFNLQKIDAILKLFKISKRKLLVNRKSAIRINS